MAAALRGDQGLQRWSGDEIEASDSVWLSLSGANASPEAVADTRIVIPLWVVCACVAT